jgi:hypothetical protein
MASASPCISTKKGDSEKNLKARSSHTFAHASRPAAATRAAKRSSAFAQAMSHPASRAMRIICSCSVIFFLYLVLQKLRLGDLKATYGGGDSYGFFVLVNGLKNFLNQALG